ncbi:MAG TPA: hypothetical protein VIH76_20505 [Candidatus Acidoferrales bacterium]
MKRTNLIIASPDHHVVLGICEQSVAREITAAAQGRAHRIRFTVCGTVSDLFDCLRRDTAAVALLDESILGTATLGDTLLQLTESSPVIVIAAPQRQAELARWIAEGDVEFVPNVGEFVSLAAAFIARRLRWAELADSRECGTTSRSFSRQARSKPAAAHRDGDGPRSKIARDHASPQQRLGA